MSPTSHLLAALDWCRIPTILAGMQPRSCGSQRSMMSSSSSSALSASIDKPGSVGKWGLSGLRSIESNLEESNLEEPSGPCPAGALAIGCCSPVSACVWISRVAGETKRGLAKRGAAAVATDSARECSGSVVSCVEIVGKSTRFLDITGTTCTASQLSGIVQTPSAGYRSREPASFRKAIFFSQRPLSFL